MAVEVVYNVADEWLEELFEDRASGSVDRDLVRVTIRYVTESDASSAEVSVQAGYSVSSEAVRLELLIGYVVRPGFQDARALAGVRDKANEAADRLRVRVAELGLSVRAGRLVTVG